MFSGHQLRCVRGRWPQDLSPSLWFGDSSKWGSQVGWGRSCPGSLLLPLWDARKVSWNLAFVRALKTNAVTNLRVQSDVLKRSSREILNFPNHPDLIVFCVMSPLSPQPPPVTPTVPFRYAYSIKNISGKMIFLFHNIIQKIYYIFNIASLQGEEYSECKF